MGKKGLPDPARRHLMAPVAKDTDADDCNFKVFTIGLRYASHGALRYSALAGDAVDAGDHLHAVR
jgi:hypothetical protein